MKLVFLSLMMVAGSVLGADCEISSQQKMHAQIDAPFQFAKLEQQNMRGVEYHYGLARKFSSTAVSANWFQVDQKKKIRCVKQAGRQIVLIPISVSSQANQAAQKVYRDLKKCFVQMVYVGQKLVQKGWTSATCQKPF